MTLQVGDRVKYVGDDEDYECAVGTVSYVPFAGASCVSVDLDHNGGYKPFAVTNLEKVSGRVAVEPRRLPEGSAPGALVNEKWYPLRWPLDTRDGIADAGEQGSDPAVRDERAQHKAEAVQQYRDEHRGVSDPKYAPQATLPFLPYKIYLAGPMRGYPRLNFPLFFQAAEILRALGFTVVNPAEMDVEVGVDKDQPDEAVADSPEFIRDAIFRDLRVVLYDVDGVVTLPGSEESKGVAVELAGAEYAGLPVFSFAEFVTAALEER